MGICLEGDRGLVGKILSEHFTPLTLDIQTGVVSDEDTSEIWDDVKEVAIEKVKRNKNRSTGGDSLMVDEEKVESPSDSGDQTTG